MGVVELEFGGVLDCYHTLFFGERADDRSKQSALSRASGPGNQDVRARNGHGLEESSHLNRQAARTCPTRLAGIALVRHQGEANAVEFSNAKGGAADRGIDGICTAPVDHAGVDERLFDVDLSPDQGDDLLNDLLELRLIPKGVGHEFQSATTLDVNLIEAVDEDVADFRIRHQWLERPEADDLVEETIDLF